METKPYLKNPSGIMPGVSRLTSNGFTLVEIIVILAVISILVAILTPTVLKYIDEARDDRAHEDVKNVSAMLNDLIRDTGQYPGDLAGTNFICGPGTIASAGSTGWAANSAACTSGTGKTNNSLSNHLLVNDPSEDGTTDSTGDYRTTGKFKWKGPYVASTSEDPWGNAYEVNVSTLKGANTSPTWVISAGPNGVLDTSTSATTLSGDDVGVRIK
ncbi:MAG: type II secretion system protein GspG [Deltaproteobacteria bacterium]|nr:type II secretion system protein GspG [Deltaproteobacteria bacterium]